MQFLMNVSSEMAFWAVREDGDGGDDAADDGGETALMAMAMRAATRVITATIIGQWQFLRFPL